MESIKQKYRSNFLDSLRGFTVILMMVFHFFFDLNFFQLIAIDFNRDLFWYMFPRIIVFLFIFISGLSLTITHLDEIKWKKLLFRQLKLLLLALIISLTTYFLFPDHWIYFGTLHAIFVITWLTLPFIAYPKLSLYIGLVIFYFSAAHNLTLPWIVLGHSSWDYISPFPWLGASLIGVFAAHNHWHQLSMNENSLVKSLNYLGKHSLAIYLIHQPLFFSLFWLFLTLKRS